MFFNPLCVILSLTGCYLLFKLKFFFVLHPFRTCKKCILAFKSVSVFKSLMLALAGTLGVGNIFGVCLGLILGGEGSVFWLFISVIFSSALKYSEVVISYDNLSHSGDGASGSMFYSLRSAFRTYGRSLAFVYALFCLLLSFSMGGGLQSGTAYETLSGLFNTPPLVFCLFFVPIIAFSIFKGVRLIEKITLYVIPFATIVYIFITIAIIILNLSNLPDVIYRIMSDAFSFDSAGGGILGFLLSSKIREGFSRGILSNEAGCGTSSMAHSRSGILNPASAGLMGILEVFFDTAVLCMLTALSVLSAIPDVSVYKEGMSLILDAVENTLGSGFEFAILVCVLIFAYSTVVCWYYYGSECFSFLVGRARKSLYFPLFILAVILGVVIDNILLVALTDCFILVLSVLTVSLLIKKSDRIKLLSEKGGVIPKRTVRIKIRGNVSSTSLKRQASKSSFRPRTRSSEK